MRVLLDEQLPRQLVRAFPGHEVFTVQSKGWSGLRNGNLLRKAREADFEVFVTADRGIEYQQDLSRCNLNVILLVTRSLLLENLLPLAAAARERLDQPPMPRLIKIGAGTAI